MKEKMTYEKPTVQKVEFDFKSRIAASSCGFSLRRLLLPEFPEGKRANLYGTL